MCLLLIRSPGSLCGRFGPVTMRRIELLSFACGVRCLEIRGGLGLIARWLREHVGP